MTKFLVDQNLPPKLARELATHYPGSRHVLDLRLDAVDDQEIWCLARDQGFEIVSKDSDFQHRALVYGSPPKVVWLTIGNCSTRDLIAFVLSHRDQLDEFVGDASASLLVLS